MALFFAEMARSNVRKAAESNESLRFSSQQGHSPMILKVGSINRFALAKRHRLGRTKKIFPERLFISAIPCQWQPCSNSYRTHCRSTSLLHLFCNGSKCKQVVVVILGLIPQNRLAASAANKIPSFQFQRVLQRVGFVAVNSHTCWERKMPGFDGVVTMIDTNVHVLSFPAVCLLCYLHQLAE